MRREYHVWDSPRLGRRMELLIFGWRGPCVLVFPTRGGRFFDYENWGLVETQAEALEWGRRQLCCLDSIDHDSLYALHLSPEQRLEKHLAYEAYVREEVIPLCEQLNPGAPLWTHGCSLGAFHAVNFALRHPERVARTIAFSGRFNLTEVLGSYPALLDGGQPTTYFHTPPWFVRGMTDPGQLAHLRNLSVRLGVGVEDVFLQSNLELATVLAEKQVSCELELWRGEAHRARDWRAAAKNAWEGRAAVRVGERAESLAAL